MCLITLYIYIYIYIYILIRVVYTVKNIERTVTKYILNNQSDISAAPNSIIVLLTRLCVFVIMAS